MFKTTTLALTTTTLSAGLAAIGTLHIVWAFTPWPLANEVVFTKTVLGNADGNMPPAPLSALVGLALIGGGSAALIESGVGPEIGPRGLRRLGLGALAAGLLARGIGGPALNSGSTEEFRHWNIVLYSPLCVVLGALAAYAFAATRPSRAVLAQSTRL